MNIWLTIGTGLSLTVGNWIYARFKDKDWDKFSTVTYYQTVALAVAYLLHRYWLPTLGR